MMRALAGGCTPEHLAAVTGFDVEVVKRLLHKPRQEFNGRHPPPPTHPNKKASTVEPASHRQDCGVGDDRAMEFLGGAIIIILVGLAIHFAAQHEAGKKPATKGEVRSVAAGVRSVAADLDGVVADLRSQRRDLSSAESDISDAESAIADLRSEIADLRSDLGVIHIRLDSDDIQMRGPKRTGSLGHDDWIVVVTY